MARARIICVGKIKTEYWQQACAHYLRLLKPMRVIELTEARDGDARLAPVARARQESDRLLACIAPNDWTIALHENGRLCNSLEFAELLRECDERRLKRPTFLIGGPFGLDDKLLQATALRLSLSPMTWPHELARVLLLEQIYRAETILRNGPYHH